MYLNYESLIKDLVSRFRQSNAQQDLKVISIQLMSSIDTDNDNPTKTYIEVTFDDLALSEEYQRHVTRFDVPWTIQSRQYQLDFRSVTLTLPK
jgi:c-di-GMP-binding flagellar brake protein YcgR